MLKKINMFSFIINQKQIVNILLFVEAILNYELNELGCLEASISLVIPP